MRVEPVDLNELDRLTAKDWAARSFYLENIPSMASSSKHYTLTSLKVFLTELLESPLEALRLPELYDPATAASSVGTPTETSRDLLSHNTYSLESRDYGKTSKNRKGKQREEREYMLPGNGGPFKGFAFVVMRDKDKAKAALERWNWEERGKMPANLRTALLANQHEKDDEGDIRDDISEDEQDEGDAQEVSDYLLGKKEKESGPRESPKDRADSTGFRVMPMYVLNETSGELEAESSK